jgi:hypothetical protein
MTDIFDLKFDKETLVQNILFKANKKKKNLEVWEIGYALNFFLLKEKITLANFAKKINIPQRTFSQYLSKANIKKEKKNGIYLFPVNLQKIIGQNELIIEMCEPEKIFDISLQKEKNERNKSLDKNILKTKLLEKLILELEDFQEILNEKIHKIKKINKEIKESKNE